MPLYSFKCEGCGRTEDVPLRLAEMNDPRQHPHCPSCPHYGRMQRVATSASLTFKGSGWTPKHY
jgi:putative FmdB family regulatory protein